MAGWTCYPLSVLRAVCGSLYGKAMIFVVACILGVEAGTACGGGGFVSVPEAVSMIVTAPLVLAIFGETLALLTYPLLLLLFIFLLFRDLPWGKVLAVSALPFLLLWLDVYVFLTGCRM